MYTDFLRIINTIFAYLYQPCILVMFFFIQPEEVLSMCPPFFMSFFCIDETWGNRKPVTSINIPQPITTDRKLISSTRFYSVYREIYVFHHTEVTKSSVIARSLLAWWEEVQLVALYSSSSPVWLYRE